MSDDASDCIRHIVDHGYAGRTRFVLEREGNLYGIYAASIAVSGESESESMLSEPGPIEGVTFAQLKASFACDDVTRVAAAAFIAGRSRAKEPSVHSAIDQMLVEFINARQPGKLGADARAYVEASMAIVLRGDLEHGRVALTAVGRNGGAGTMADYLAAFYLAQLGDSSGFLTIVSLLDGDDGFGRLMAARHLIGFMPYETKVVDELVVNVRARLLDRIDDRDELVAREIPALLAEAGYDSLHDDLKAIAKKARHQSTRRAAQALLD
jgi:hypothetical protein